LVRDYYTSLNERRFEDAWAELSPAIRARFGGFARWQAGYARTVASEPTDLTTRADGEALIVSLRLVAHEKRCSAVQSFHVIWTLERVSRKWSVVGLSGRVAGSRACE
jgi:hypothetical protein